LNKIKVVTDSTADLSSEMIKKYGIEVVPLSISINGETFLDRVDITPKEFIEKMKESDELPKSSQPATGVFHELYERLDKEGYEILSIHMTGGMSGTVRSAESAARMTKAKVTVIDSLFISKALAFQVIEAAEMAQQGKTMEEIVSRINEIREQTRLLVKGGRIGKGKALIGSLLNIKPIASLEDGVYNPVAKVRSHTQVVKYLAKQFAEDVKGKTIKRVGLAHAEGIELAEKLKSAIYELTGFIKIDIDDTTPVISTHTGVGAIGFMYYFE
jgi:DegV family protein with EDD domain